MVPQRNVHPVSLGHQILDEGQFLSTEVFLDEREMMELEHDFATPNKVMDPDNNH